MGAFCGCAAKPGFPLQSFLPQTAKKDFRCNPWRAHGLAVYSPVIAKGLISSCYAKTGINHGPHGQTRTKLKHCDQKVRVCGWLVVSLILLRKVSYSLCNRGKQRAPWSLRGTLPPFEVLQMATPKQSICLQVALTLSGLLRGARPA
jgi:hypothetical protein